MKHVLAVALLTLCLVFVFYGYGAANATPTRLVGKWIFDDGSDGGLDGTTLYLLKSGSAVMTEKWGDTIKGHWYVSGNRFVTTFGDYQYICSPPGCSFKLDGYYLTFTSGEVGVLYIEERGIRIREAEKAAEDAERARKAKAYKYTGRTAKIGEQTWMAENLNSEAAGGLCYKLEESNCEKYGRLYTWDEAVKACPNGWHLPKKAEWATLISSLSLIRSEGIGRRLKSRNGWDRNSNGTDEYGFAALPGGSFGGSFEGAGCNGVW